MEWLEGIHIWRKLMLEKSQEVLHDSCTNELASGCVRDCWLEAGRLFPKVRYSI